MIQEANQYRYEYMRLEKIRQVIKNCPFAIFPSGLLEWHGEQNAIGLDALKGYYICERTMLLMGGGALLPINWIGTYGFIRYEGTVCFDQSTTKEVFVRIYKELMKIGFKVIVIFTGHYGFWQEKVLNEAKKEAEEFAKKNDFNVRLLGLKPPNLVPHMFKGGKHAGIYETSMLLRTGQAYDLDLVNMDLCKKGKEEPPQYNLKYDKDIPVREPKTWKWNKKLIEEKYCSVEVGEKFISAISRGLALEIIDSFEELGINYTPKYGNITPPI